jgi:hypothetical protein
MASTGPLAPFGETAAFAGERGAAEINNAGGIFIKELGKKLPIRMKPVDSESDPRMGLSGKDRNLVSVAFS